VVINLLQPEDFQRRLTNKVDRPWVLNNF